MQFGGIMIFIPIIPLPSLLELPRPLQVHAQQPCGTSSRHAARHALQNTWCRVCAAHKHLHEPPYKPQNHPYATKASSSLDGTAAPRPPLSGTSSPHIHSIYRQKALRRKILRWYCIPVVVQPRLVYCTRLEYVQPIISVGYVWKVFP